MFVCNDAFAKIAGAQVSQTTLYRSTRSAADLSGHAGLATGLMLDACHLVDLRERQFYRPPVMQLHAGAAEAISQLSEVRSRAEFVRLYTLLRCAQQPRS